MNRRYFAGMTQAEAVGILSSRAPRGGFLVTGVRNAPGVFLAHIKEALLVRTQAIRQEAPGVFRLGHLPATFATVMHLVLHYSRNSYADDVDGQPCTLFLSRGEV